MADQSKGLLRSPGTHRALVLVGRWVPLAWTQGPSLVGFAQVSFLAEFPSVPTGIREAFCRYPMCFLGLSQVPVVVSVDI